MKLIQHYHCILASAAMALEQTPEKLIGMLGHDGMEVILPSLPKPGCYKGFHTQEIIEVILRLGKTATLVEARPCQIPAMDFCPTCKNPTIPPKGSEVIELKSIGPFRSTTDRFEFYLNHRQGILIGSTGSLHHACGFSYGTVYDPRGLVSSLSDCKIQVVSLLIVE